MPHIEGHATVSGHQINDDALRDAFRSLSETFERGCSSEDLDRVWRAVAGTLPVAERHDLIDRLATDPALAEAWRVAHDLQQANETTQAAATPVRRHATSWPLPWLAAAAALLIGAATVVVIQRSRPEVNDTFRTSNHYVVESLVPPDATLARDAFRLRWTPGPPQSRYQVRVTTEDLRVLKTATDLTTSELVIERSLLSEIPAGARVLWQVDVALPGGERVSSETFTTRVQ